MIDLCLWHNDCIMFVMDFVCYDMLPKYLICKLNVEKYDNVTLVLICKLLILQVQSV